MTARPRDPPEFSPRFIVLWALGGLAGAVLFSLPIRTAVSLAVGGAIGHLLFVLVMRRIY
jgi:hypothetical protein